MTKRGISAAVAVALLAGLVSVQATANAAESCSMQLGSVTAGGDHRGQGIASTTPPTMLGDSTGPSDVYADGFARLSGPMAYEYVVPAGEQRGGWVILGSSMYVSGYTTDHTGRATVPDSVMLRLVGNGWDDVTAFQSSRYYEGPAYAHLRMNQYALRNDGVLTRWTIVGNAWRDPQQYSGFAAVKTMTLISQTRSYDSFLANTHNGALYSIRIPTGSPSVPVVRILRTADWQEFDTLVAEPCGSSSTIVLGIDKETRTGKLFAIGHANGIATDIHYLGELPVELNDPAYFRWYLDSPQAPKLYGE
jgi:hypothetical protein